MIVFLSPDVCRRHEVGLVTAVSLLRIRTDQQTVRALAAGAGGRATPPQFSARIPSFLKGPPE